MQNSGTAGPPEVGGPSLKASRRIQVYTALEIYPDACSYGTKNLLKNIRARGRIIILFYRRAVGALKIWQINSAILKVPDGASSC